MKRGVPVAIGAQPAEVLEVCWRRPSASARRCGCAAATGMMAAGRYSDATGSRPAAASLPGAFQFDNAGIAIAALRASGLPMDVAGIAAAEWPARLQRLHGRLAALLPSGWELWLDGGHNPGGGQRSGRASAVLADRPMHLVVGMKQAKDAAEFLRPLLPLATTVWAVAEAGPARRAAGRGDRRGVGRRCAAGSACCRRAAHALPRDRAARVLICGSLYLAGEVLKQDQ